MILDSSALMAIVEGEVGSERLASALVDAGTARISAGTLLEVSIVADRRGVDVARNLDRLLRRFQVETVPTDVEQVQVARAAHRDYGRGSGHPAQLNFGDCFAYALASVVSEPLLFTGDDFSHTDIRSALA